MSNPNQNLPAPILVLDDSEDDLFFLKRLISQSGVSLPVLAFSSGHAAVKYLKEALSVQAPDRVPSFVFTDIKMPEMTGFEFIEWIRSEKSLHRLPVVVLSSSNHPSDLARCEELGVYRHYVKFPKPDEIARLLRETGHPMHARKPDCSQ